MEILKTQTTEQSIKIIPRVLQTDVHLYLVDKEQEINVIDLDVTGVIENEFLTIPLTANFFKEGRKYHIKVTDANGVRLWMGLAMCTDKTDLQNYKIYE
mgnify:CR=1 FL=1